jgi:hypothetical protein
MRATPDVPWRFRTPLVVPYGVTGDGVSDVVVTDVAGELVDVGIEMVPPVKNHVVPAINAMIASAKAMPLMLMDFPLDVGRSGAGGVAPGRSSSCRSMATSGSARNVGSRQPFPSWPARAV